MTAHDRRARPTIYNGVQMRSRLEAGYAAWLDQWNFTWEYEPQAFASKDGQYLPDFLLRKVREATAHGTIREKDVYVEVKPASWQGDLDALGRRMEIIEASRNHFDTILLLEVPGRPPLQWLRGHQEPGSWHEMCWTYNVAIGDNLPLGVNEYEEYLAIAMTLGRDLAPWPHGYWDGPR